MKSKLAKLIDVKSIMTLMLTLVFCVLALLGTISGTEFLTIFTVIVGFYFGTQASKKAVADTKAPADVAVGTVAEVPVTIPETVDSATYEKMHPSDEAVSRR